MDVEDARDALAKLLAARPGLAHLRVSKRGSSLTVNSGTGPSEQKHARLTHLTGSTWGLSFPHHTGRWERTPFTGSLAELLDTMVDDFPFLLESQ